MAQKKYNKEQFNPLQKKWEKTGVAILLKEEAEVLNESSKYTGIKYVGISNTKK